MINGHEPVIRIPESHHPAAGKIFDAEDTARHAVSALKCVGWHHLGRHCCDFCVEVIVVAAANCLMLKVLQQSVCVSRMNSQIR
jgi:hypothetical protein